MIKSYTTKQLGHDLKRFLNEKHDIDVAKIGMWCDYKLNRDVYNEPEKDTALHLKTLAMMQNQNFAFSHSELNKIADCFIEGIDIDLNEKGNYSPCS